MPDLPAATANPVPDAVPRQPVLHYFHDPLCGWCYAAEPLARALVQAKPATPGLAPAIEVHGGGLFAGGPLAPAKRDLVRGADARIGQLTGQRFETAYLDHLLVDPSTVYDSGPPIAAVLAAQKIGHREEANAGLAMLKAVQHAHYRGGRAVTQTAVLCEAAAQAGFDADAFRPTLLRLLGAPTQSHIAESRAWMGRLGVAGFPAFVLQCAGRWTPVRHEAFYGRPTDFVREVQTLIAGQR